MYLTNASDEMRSFLDKMPELPTVSDLFLFQFKVVLTNLAIKLQELLAPEDLKAVAFFITHIKEINGIENVYLEPSQTQITMWTVLEKKNTKSEDAILELIWELVGKHPNSKIEIRYFVKGELPLAKILPKNAKPLLIRG